MDASHFRQRRHLFVSLAARWEQAAVFRPPRPRLASALRRALPVCDWLRHYDWRESFFADLSAGLTMAVFMVPTGIAHAGICGVEPVYGLYTSIFPTFLYMIFGTSKFNALGPFAILSVLTHSVIEKVQASMAMSPVMAELNATDATGNLTDLVWGASGNGTDPDAALPLRPIHIATTVMFLSGVFHVGPGRFEALKNNCTLLQIVLGMIRADFLSCYLSEQVMSGFIVGGFVHVFFAQIGEVLGIKLPARAGPGSLLLRVQDLYEHLGEAQLPTVVISLASVLFLAFARLFLDPWLGTVFDFPVPYELLLVVVGITATNYADLSNRHGVAVVGNIPTDFPPPALPRFDLIPSIFVTTLGITIVTVAIHLTVVKLVEIRHREKVRPCRELYSLGVVGVLSSAFPVFPVTSIFARTLVGNPDKNTTQMTVCFSSLALLAVVLYIGPALEYLPKVSIMLMLYMHLQCVLASIILMSLSAGFDKVRELRPLWPLFKTDLFIFLVTCLLTVGYELAKGLILAVAFAVMTTVVRNQCSSWHFLLEDSELAEFAEISKQTALHELDGPACVFRFDGALIFTSAQKFAKSVRKAVKRWERRDALKTDEAGFRWRERPRPHRTLLVVDCSGFPYVDFMGLMTLRRVYTDFARDGVCVRLAAPKASLRRMFESTDFHEQVPRSAVFPSVKRAVEAGVEDTTTNDARNPHSSAAD